MPRYFILLIGSGDYATLSPDQQQKVLADYMAWRESLIQKRVYVDAERLGPECRIIEPGPKPVAMDGPFAESKEFVAGYFVVQTANIDEAVELAYGCPHLQHVGYIQVRGVFETPSNSGESQEPAAARA